ncbi:FKBP-type peptidyl-prolyl cis-trans isomerase [Mucilaginibacter sp. HMF5004]|uniref:FKBP-type peptidyl-prolyl cis-trans isomerase n=1 Tax=Mucilaginibacter rivuli TaxID=2857527 RepID=UPI001C5E38AF|nr:FKBP-type peptidyl-prolyl cis-trans isomerase [Mucilaginibacter rivuli]MBW4891067.1 FKBP-type peptidyl-prolyl cis-trans isomerase [Mucilaginibacter rivuli]
MKKKLMLLAVAAITIAGCKNFKQGDGGTLYSIVEDKTGPLIKEGDIISLNGVIKNEGDSVLSSTYDAGHPASFAVPKFQFKGDLMWALQQLSEGDSAVFKINVDTVAKKSGQPKPPGFKGKYYIYSLRIVKVFSKQKNEADSVFQKRVSAYFKDLSDKAKNEEPANIKKYIADKKLAVTTTPSGLNYVITTPGNGPKPAVGDTAIVNYTGTFLNGKVFDTSIEAEAKKANKFQPGRPYAPAHITVGVHSVIPGWDEGLQLMPKGSKATFVIPSILGYGEQGMQGAISPFTPLVFEIEMIDVKHADPNAPKPAAAQQSLTPEQMQQLKAQMQQAQKAKK